MSTPTFAPSRLIVLAFGTLASTTAFAWGDAAVAAWTARNAALVAAVNQPIGAGAPAGADGKPALYVVNSRGFVLGYKQTAEEEAATGASGAWVTNIEDQCKGLTGEHIKNGGSNMPTWAQTAQGRFCGGVKATGNALADKSHDKQRCKDLASAIDYLRKPKAGEDPETVVQSAAELIAAAEKLRAMPIVMMQKGKVLGDGHRSFTCD
jgi:hypothetical protein